MIKSIISITIIIHGILHLIGFILGFELINIGIFTKEINKTEGSIWLFAFALFILSFILFYRKKETWWITLLKAILISQILIILNWSDACYGSIINIVLLLIVFLGFKDWQFYSKFKNIVEDNISQKNPESGLLTEQDILHLPEPVKKYIAYSCALNNPKVFNFKLTFSGRIRKNELAVWMPFTSSQYNFLSNSTRLFFMKAIMKYLPVRGFHCFRKGKAYMDIRLLSIYSVQYQSGKEMDIAETVTFFNDMCCMAPACLVDKRINWLETDGNMVTASFSINDITITASLYFNDSGELINFVSNDRYTVTEKNIMRKIPWSTPLQDYKLINDRMLPTKAKTIYSYKDGDFCYGEFNLINVQYNCI